MPEEDCAVLEVAGEADEEGATVEVAADDAREEEAVALPPDEGAMDEEVPLTGSEEDVGVVEFPAGDVGVTCDEAPVTVLDADTEAVDEARVSEDDEDSAADDKTGDVEDEMGAESDDATADVGESEVETAIDDTDSEDSEDTVLGTAGVSDAVEDDTEGAPEPVAEGGDREDPEEAVGSVDEASETELAACDGSGELDGSAGLDRDALGPKDWSLAAEAEDPAALLPDETDSDAEVGACVEDVTDDDGAAVVE